MGQTNQMSKILEGDVLAAAKLMRDIEDEASGAIKELANVYLHTGRAHIVGVAGAPGAGKSTVIGSLINIFRKQNMTVGVVAVDPSSPFTGGALLGDRIRMQEYGLDKDVFIRSLASRGWRGGLSKATVSMVHVMDAMGKDIIFVESIGSGQGEVDIARVTDTTIIILTPGMGDEIQMMKAGILEVADIFVINKADRDGASVLKGQLETMLEMKGHLPGGWRPCVILIRTISDAGVDELTEEILKHREFLISNGELEKRRKITAELELTWAVESSLKNYFDRLGKGYLEKLVDDLVHRKTNPRSAALKIINPSQDS